ncbi:MAG TPA: hypothetical protein GXX36_08355 [Clostridiaceae bacterium]|nr:hypothetical protein [Clostridiaceae bacterium]
MTAGEVLFTGYNQAVEQGYNNVFKGMNKKNALNGVGPEAEEIEKSVRESVKKWEETPVEALDNLTPVQYINKISDFDYLIELFKEGSRICDDNMPAVFLDKLKEYNSEAVDAVMKLAADKELLENSKEADIPVMAVKVLGEWKIDWAVDQLIELLFETAGKNELFADSIKNALISIGKPSIEKIMQALNKLDVSGDVQEYLVTALAEAGKHNRSDDIYRCLKSTFMKMENKTIGAICLGNYGDGRAIPALRGYIQKNRNTLDPETYWEIKSAIYRLGGQIGDI